MKNDKRIGLALSGGGYRAAAFHLGTFRCLHKLGILKNVAVISTVSGGSLAGAYYLLNGEKYDEFENGFTQALGKSVIFKVIFSLRFMLTLLLILILWGAIIITLNGLWLKILLILISIVLCLLFLFKIIPLTKLKEKAYRKIFFRNATLNNFSDSPTLAINSTNLESGRLMTFSKNKISDSFYKYEKGIRFLPNSFPVSYAVACSTAVPYPFHPLNIPKKYFEQVKDYKTIKPALVDGGIYDNQGIHKITQIGSSYKCDIIICSDASTPFKRSFLGINPLPILRRVMNVMMVRIKNFQFIQHVYDTNETSISEIAYFSLDWGYNRCIEGFYDNLTNNKIRLSVIDKHQIPENIYTENGNPDKKRLEEFVKQKISFNEIIKDGLTKHQILSISNISTNLHSLSRSKINLLSKHAEVLTEIQLKLYCPSLFNN